MMNQPKTLSVCLHENLLLFFLLILYFMRFMGFLLQFRPHFLEVPSALLLALLFLRMQGASLRHLLAVALQFGLAVCW